MKNLFQKILDNTRKAQKIVITGGKGGTGKSTVAVLMANAQMIIY